MDRLNRLALEFGALPGDDRNPVILQQASELLLAIDQAMDRVQQSYPEGIHTLAVMVATSYTGAAVVAQAATKAGSADDRQELFRRWLHSLLDMTLDLHMDFIRALRAGRLQEGGWTLDPDVGKGPLEGNGNGPGT
jgi:hypothetical protein